MAIEMIAGMGTKGPFDRKIAAGNFVLKRGVLIHPRKVKRSTTIHDDSDVSVLKKDQFIKHQTNS